MKEEEENYYKILKEKGNEIMQLAERMREQEMYYEILLSNYEKNLKMLEEKKQKLNSEENDLQQKFLDAVENEDFFKNPKNEEVKLLVNEAKLKKQKLNAREKNLEKEEENLKKLEEDLQRKVKEMPQNKQDLYNAIENNIMKEHPPTEKEKEILKQNKPLSNFISKVCDKFQNKRKGLNYFDDLENENDINSYIQKLLKDPDFNVTTPKGKAPSTSKGDEMTSATDYRENKYKPKYEETERALTTISTSQDFENLGALNKSFYLKRNKIMEDQIKKKPALEDVSESDELKCNKCRKDREKTHLLFETNTSKTISVTSRATKFKSNSVEKTSLLKQRQEQKRMQSPEILVGNRYVKQSLIGRATDSEYGLVITKIEDNNNSNINTVNDE